MPASLLHPLSTALAEAVAFLRERWPFEPQIGIVLGSGLGELTERLEDKHVVPYSQIPHMPTPRVEGHAGELHLGILGGAKVACLSGRAHLYEGHPPSDVVFGARLLKMLGAPHVIVTNAAGGIARNLSAGSLVLLQDHLNLTGQNPLVGANMDLLGPRFPDMSQAYDLDLRALAIDVAQKQELPLHTGVYAGVLGPNYETPAEIEMLDRLGASVVGMSTVLEVIALRHMGARVLGLSCVTNLAAGRSTSPLSHAEVAETAGRVGAKFCDLVEGLCKSIVRMPP